jgi:YYY domain-containing protein
MIILTTLKWYFFIEILALISFILGFKLFHNLDDKGYAVSKATGISLAAFISWLIMSYNIGSYSYDSLITYISAGVLGVTAIVTLFVKYNKEILIELYTFIDKRYKYIFFIELSFILILLGGTYLRGFAPDILEINKLQDFAYIQSIIGSDQFPPENIWLAGHTINYYYFGYFLTANLILFSGISSEIAYNLMPGTILGIIAITAGSIVYNMTGKRLYGIFAGLFTCVLGNYAPLMQILEKGLANGYDWWPAAHIMKNDIFTEFSLWSATLGDLQPFFTSQITLIAFVFIVFTAVKEHCFNIVENYSSKTVVFLILISIFLALNIFSNIFTIFITLFIIIILPLYHIKNCENKRNFLIHHVLTIITVILFSAILLSPFILDYTFPYTNITLTRPELYISLKSYIIVFGIFFIPIILYYLVSLYNKLRSDTTSLIYTGITVFSFIEAAAIYKTEINPVIIKGLFIIILLATGLTALIFLLRSTSLYLKKRNTLVTASIIILLIGVYLISNNITLVISSILLAGSIYFSVYADTYIKYFTTGLLICCLLTLMIADTFYLKIMNDSNMVTYSYLSIQVLLLLPMILVLSFYLSMPELKSTGKDIYITIISILLIPGVLFLILGPYYKNNKFQPIEGLIPALSGIQHMEKFHTADYESLMWMKEMVPTGTVILEGHKEGSPFTGRISAYTGLPTVLGWFDRQLFAYGPPKYDELTTRKEDINRIYTAADKTTIQELIQKYDIEYIFIGELENQIYPAETLDQFNQIGTLEYQSSQCNKCRIYKLHRNPAN